MAQNTVIERKVYSEGDIVFKQGSTGRLAYILQSGAVDIFCHGPATPDGSLGPEIPLATVGKGAIFGEMALISEKPRMATARVSEGCTLIVITEHMFKQKLNATDPFIRGMMNIMSETIRTMSEN